jgi:hypothetical protein
MALIDTLPFDILATIFRICETDSPQKWTANIPAPNSAPSLPSVAIFNGPWHFAQVCSHWRDIASSYPLLWSYITIRNGPWQGAELSSSASLARIQWGLRCSHPTALDISCHYPGVFAIFSSLLTEHASRWRQFYISDRIYSLSENGLLPLQGEYPLLTTLRIFDTSDREIDGTISFFNPNSNCTPPLRSIRYTGGIRADNLLLPTENVEEISIWIRSELSGPVVDSHLHFLKDAKRLKSLTSTITPRLIPQESRTEPLTLPLVTSISLDSLVLLPYIHLPSLQKLQFVTSEDADADHTSSALSHTLSRFRCSLQSLDLSFQAHTPSAVTFRHQFSVMLTCLTKLCLTVGDWSRVDGSSFIADFVTELRRDDWLGRLTSLSLEMRKRTFAADSAALVAFICSTLIDTIRARRNPNNINNPSLRSAPLEAFRFECSEGKVFDVETMLSDEEYTPEEVRQAYRELKDNGMKLFVLSSALSHSSLTVRILIDPQTLGSRWIQEMTAQFDYLHTYILVVSLCTSQYCACKLTISLQEPSLGPFAEETLVILNM